MQPESPTAPVRLCWNKVKTEINNNIKKIFSFSSDSCLPCPFCSCLCFPGVQAHGHDLPEGPESGLPQGGALPQPVPEASQSPAAQVSITPAYGLRGRGVKIGTADKHGQSVCGITRMVLRAHFEGWSLGLNMLNR